MSNISLYKSRYDNKKYLSVKNLRRTENRPLGNAGSLLQRYPRDYDVNANQGVRSPPPIEHEAQTSVRDDDSSNRDIHASGTTWVEKYPDGYRYSRYSEIEKSSSDNLKIENVDSVWRATLDRAMFGYAVFAFVSCTSAFKLFGVAAPAFGLVYLGGLIMIAIQARQFLAQPLALFLAMLFPLFALVSVFWGVEPEITLRNSVQLTFTALIGVSIGCSFRPDRLMMAMFVAFTGLILLSVVNLWLQVVPAFQQRDYLEGNEYFTGIFAHKNTLGMVLCLGALCLAYMASSRRLVWPFAIVLIALFPIFLFARSTTSIALYAFILTMPIACMYMRSIRWRLLIFLCLFGVVLLAGMFMEIKSISLIDIGLELVGKGRDMSGRTSLWMVASDQIRERPWLGVGYQSFWSAVEYSREVEIIRGTLESSIKHFHNTWLETLVGVGILGLLSLLALPVYLLCRFLFRLGKSEWSPTDVAGLFFVVLLLIRANVETTIYYQHNVETLILIALLFSTAKYASSGRENEREMVSKKLGLNDTRNRAVDASHSTYYR